MIQAEADPQPVTAIVGDDLFGCQLLLHAGRMFQLESEKIATRQTGDGVAYLRQGLERSFFPELWPVRTKL